MKQHKWGIGSSAIVLGFLTFAMIPVMCYSPVPEPGELPPSEEQLPPLEEQEVMDRRISYCQKKFGPGQDSRYACIMGYLAQPIHNSLNEFDE
ncbi:MAG: hypothetical protein OXG94_12290 [Bacteroidetes bacterium]|nr:hypothetical protein [Bacteroidota bacterium]